MFTYYRPGYIEAIRDLGHRCEGGGLSMRLLTPRSSLGTRIARKFSGPDWMLALHTAGGGWFHDLTSKETTHYSKRRIENFLKEHGAKYSRTATR